MLIVWMINQQQNRTRTVTEPATTSGAQTEIMGIHSYIILYDTLKANDR